MAPTTNAPPDIPVMVPQLPQWEAVSRYAKQIDVNRWYSNFGPLTCELEHRLANHFGGQPKTVLSVGNATLGISIALQEIAISGSTACLLPSWTFVATAHAAHAAGLQPVFADVDPVDGMLTPELAEDALRLHPQIGAVIVVGPFGMNVSVSEWQAFRSRTGIPVIIDAAAGFNSVALSDIPTVVSLHATKPLGCGEGGFVMSSDQGLITRLTGRSNFGFMSTREAMMIGTNAKMSEYHAAVALAALDEWAERRAVLCRIADLYRTALVSRNWATLQRGWGEDWVSTTCNLRLVPKVHRAGFDAFMREAGIDIRRWWGFGCHNHPAFARCTHGPLPTTTDFAAHLIGVPFSHDLTPAQVERVVTTLEAAVMYAQEVDHSQSSLR